MATNPAENLPENLHPLFGINGDLPYLERADQVKNLGDALPDADVAGLLRFLGMMPLEVRLNEGEFNALGDVVLTCLDRQDPLPPTYVAQLAKICGDARYNYIWRDYCLQHMGAIFSRLAPDDQGLVRQVFDGAFCDPRSPQGTVLLAMQLNVGETGFLKKNIADRAMEVVLNKAVAESSRLTALQVAAHNGNPAALQFARQVVDSSHSAHFRMSAMSVVGELGHSSDLPMLEKHSASSDIRLREASKAAIGKINARLVAVQN